MDMFEDLENYKACDETQEDLPVAKTRKYAKPIVTTIAGILILSTTA